MPDNKTGIMKYMVKYCLLMIMSFRPILVKCQPVDSIQISQKKSHEHSYISFKRQLIPLSLISGGLMIEATGIKDELQEIFPGTHTHIEDYLQYAPIPTMYCADLAGIPHRNTVFNQTKFLLI